MALNKQGEMRRQRFKLGQIVIWRDRGRISDGHVTKITDVIKTKGGWSRYQVTGAFASGGWSLSYFREVRLDEIVNV